MGGSTAAPTHKPVERSTGGLLRPRTRAKENWRSVPTYGKLLAPLTIALLTFLATGVWVLESGADGGWAEFGKWCFTAATTCLTAGLFAALFKIFDERRARRATWESQLYELVSLHQRLRTAARLIRSRRDDATVSEQIEKILVVRSELRAVAARANINKHSVVGPELQKMLDYLKQVCEEHARPCSPSGQGGTGREGALVRGTLLWDFVFDKHGGPEAVEYWRAYSASKRWMRYQSGVSPRKPAPDGAPPDGRLEVEAESDIEDTDGVLAR